MSDKEKEVEEVKEESAPEKPKRGAGTKKEEEEISVPASQLKALIEQNQALKDSVDQIIADKRSSDETIEGLKTKIRELGSEGISPFAEEVKTNTASIRMIDNMPVIGFVDKNTMSKGKPRYWYDEVNPAMPTEILTFIDMKVHGKEKPVKVNQKEIDNLDKVDVEIISTEKKKRVLNQGKVDKIEHEDWRAVSAGYKVDANVIYEDIFHTVKLPNGDEVQVHEQIINI